MGKFIGGKVLTAVLVVTAGASLIWAWNNPETLQSVWATSKVALVWLGFVLVFPWAMFFVPVKVVKLESNGAAAAMLLGYLTVDILVAYWLADWSIHGTLTWVMLLLGFLAAGVYNFVVCDYVAARAEESV